MQQAQEAVQYQRRLRSAHDPEQPRQLTVFQRQKLKANVALKKQKKLYSSRRILRWGEKRRVILLRFGRLGSTVVNGLSYTRIARQLLIKRPTVISVVQAYLQRGGQLPVSHRVRTQKKLTVEQRAWATST